MIGHDEKHEGHNAPVALKASCEKNIDTTRQRRAVQGKDIGSKAWCFFCGMGDGHVREKERGTEHGVARRYFKQGFVKIVLQKCGVVAY